MKIRTIFSILLLLSLLPGCGGGIPFKYVTPDEYYERKSTIESIYPSTQEGVIRQLGEPDWIEKSGSSTYFIYQSEAYEYGVGVIILPIIPYRDTHVFCLFLEFDETNHLVEHTSRGPLWDDCNDYFYLSGSREIEKQEEERLSDAKLYDQLLTLCREADAGHTKAQFEIGRIYWRKNFIPDNRSKSYMWYMLAATSDFDGVQHQDEAFQKSAAIDAEYKRDHVLSDEELNKAMQLLSVWAPGQCEHELAPDNAGN